MSVIKTFTYLKLKCEIKINDDLGNFCGYVTLPKGHPWSDKDENAIDADVHGGLTYKEGRTIGFDCAHAGDTWPGRKSWYPVFGKEHLWTVAEVEAEVRKLARQVREAK